MKEEKKMSTFQVLKRNLRILKEKRKWLAFLILSLNMIVGGILPIIAVYIPRIIIDYLNTGASKDTIINSIITLTAITLLCAMIKVICDNYDMGFFMSIRIDEFNKVITRFQEIDYSYLEDPQFEDQATVAIEALNSNNMGFENIYHSIFKLLPLCFSIIFYCFLIGLLQPIIFLACIIGGFITVIVNRGIAKYIDKRKEDRARAIRQKNYFYNICYDFTYGKDIRVYNLRDKLVNDYKKKSYNYLTVIKNIANRRFLLGLLELIMLLLQDGIAYYFVIKGYYNHQLTLGEVSLYISAIIALSTSLREFTNLLSNLNIDANYCKNYYHFMDDNSYFTFKGHRKAIPKNETLEIEFKNVSFKYPKTERWILKDFNFKINKGEKLAIVGINGAGKSTIVKLITGLFDVTEGEIFINGINIKEFDQKEYQKMFSVVFQEVFIYATTVLENVIGLDTLEEERKKGMDCLKRVGLKEKIESLPNGYEQQLLKVIDENGVELSGGQNQKIAIARALYKDANMVILDEPTASLDALAEAEIYQSFNDLVKDKTAIYISHRLSSTKFCDKIALFSPSGLIEYGSHDELMAKKGPYYEMFMTQGKYYQEEVSIDEQN